MKINEKRVALHIRNFERALAGYTFNEPLSRYLTRFFKENRQMGSSDRKMTSRFIYNYFRLGNAFFDETILHRLTYAEFLCEHDSDVVHLYASDLSKHSLKDIHSKVEILQESYNFNIEEVFPMLNELSSDIERNAFIHSHFIQPSLFIRIRRGYEEYVASLLDEKSVEYQRISKNTLALSNGFRLQDFRTLIGKIEVQDLSSQRTVDFMDAENGESWWDACAASGGKTLMLLDKYPHLNMMVSDIRLSILRNLNERFESAKIKVPKRQKILDLTQDTTNILGNEQFDGILLDVPCSGSGTWGRTPEMIQQFSSEKLEEFSKLQKKIVSNVVKHLKVGKPLVYMTCSVYSKENEDVVQYIVDQFGFEIEKMELIKGYNKKADSMFAARLIRKGN